MSDDSDIDDPHSFNTLKIPADEMRELQEAIDESEDTVELTIEVEAATLARVKALIPRLEPFQGSDDELRIVAAVRRIFMTGLRNLEDEFDE